MSAQRFELDRELQAHSGGCLDQVGDLEFYHSMAAIVVHAERLRFLAGTVAGNTEQASTDHRRRPPWSPPAIPMWAQQGTLLPRQAPWHGKRAPDSISFAAV
jgi:hypothetical protein